MTTTRSTEEAPIQEAPRSDNLPPRQHVLDLDDYSRTELTATLESARGMAEVLGRDIKRRRPCGARWW